MSVSSKKYHPEGPSPRRLGSQVLKTTLRAKPEKGVRFLYPNKDSWYKGIGSLVLRVFWSLRHSEYSILGPNIGC